MSKGKGKKIRHISISPAKNGFTVRHEPDDGNGPGPSAMMGGAQENVFTSPSEASAHVTSLLHGHAAAMGNDNDGDEMPEHFKKATPRFTNRKPSY